MFEVLAVLHRYEGAIPSFDTPKKIIKISILLNEREKGRFKIMLTKGLVVAIQEELKKEGVEASQATVKAHLKAYETVVIDTLKKGEDVKQKGFVDFTTKEVPARTARNPQTGEPVEVPAHRKATASLSKALRKL
ncbi:HU family DNA-binding protein [Bacillus subtilis]|nr:HU family DNA-binding protein [Bacillus subtilis]MED3474720.1 HU family DNA-binding protein [Bacillus subtilis]